MNKTTTPNRTTSKFIYLVISIISVAVLSGLLFYAGDIKGLCNRMFRTPPIIRDQRIVPVVLQNKGANTHKKQCFDAYQKKTGFYGIVKKQTTVEGNLIYVYLIINQGCPCIVIDYTHDPYSNRDFKIYKPLDIKLGTFESKGNFIETAQATDKEKTWILKITLSDNIIYLCYTAG